MVNFLNEARLYRVSEIRRDKALLPSERGIYGLFFDKIPGGVPAEGCFVRDGLHLLYIGTAGADLRKMGSLRARLGDHHLGGNERRSTICQTLAALMPEVAGRCLEKQERRGAKYYTSNDGVLKMQAWMDEHIWACWTVYPDPGTLERELIAQYALPLNLEYNSRHPFARQLGELREKRRSLASPVDTRTPSREAFQS